MADHAMISDEAGFAPEAYHAVLADTAAYSPSAGAWTVSGDDVYRESGKVGIGTTSPLTELDVVGSVTATTYYGDGSNLTGISGTSDNDWTISGDTIYHETGNVGIGTSSPEMKLDVSGGTTRLDGSLIVGPASYSVTGVHIYSDDVPPTLQLTNAGNMGSTCRIEFADTSNAYWSIESDLFGNHGRTLGIIDSHAKNCRVFIDSAGQVGIGTLSPTRTLDVAGAVNATTYYGDGSNLTGISGTTDNDWTISGNNMYSAVPGSVGVGTSSPEKKLHVAGDVKATTYYGDGSNLTGISGTTDNDWTISGSDMYAGVSGNVGIGVAGPVKKLDVAGDLNLNRGIASGIALWVNGDEAVWYNGTYFSWGHGGTANYFADDIGIGTSSPVNRLDVKGAMAVGANYSGISTAPSNGMIIEGTVGIGTSSPSLQNKLEVSGGTSYSIHTTWNGASSGAAISATNSGTGGDAIQVNANGSGRSAIYASAVSGVDYGIYCAANYATWSGYFAGNVNVTGTLSKGGGSFLIDHPLDPENKLLRHNFVESPNNLLIYTGKIGLDANGQAVVHMPDYFAALTREDEAYIHLTPVGRPFPVGAEWNPGFESFTVYGQADRNVFWEVLADRDDPVIRQLGRPVVEEKGPDNALCDKGELLYPTAYGYPESRSRDYKELENTKKREQERLEELE
jgi:hypothetical protein